jgi:hypothetical protein
MVCSLRLSGVGQASAALCRGVSVNGLDHVPAEAFDVFQAGSLYIPAQGSVLGARAVQVQQTSPGSLRRSISAAW